MDISGELYYHFPDVEAIALVFLQLTRGMLEIKIELGELDNLEIHQKDLEDVAKHFQSNENIGLECMICYANLQTSCAMTAQSKHVFPIQLSFVEQNIDNMEVISARFPKNKEINLIYCRSLAATSSDLYNHPNREMYKKFVLLLKNLVQTRKFDVPANVMDFLKEA